MKRFLLILILACLYSFPLCAQVQFSIHNVEGLKVIRGQNDFLSTEYSFEDDVELKLFQSRKDFFIYREKLEGAKLVLYKDKMFEDENEIINISDHYIPRKLKNDQGVRLDRIGKGPLRLKHIITMSAKEAILSQTTSISNQSDKKITLYPTEIYPFHYELSASKSIRRPTNIYVYSKYDDKDLFQVDKKEDDPSPFHAINEKKLLYANPDTSSASLTFTNHDSWFAVQNAMNGRLMAIEYRYADHVRPQKIPYNVVFSTGNDLKDSQFLLKYCMGKVELEPGEEFAFVKRMYTNTCLGPIVKMEDGVVFNREFGAMKTEMGFYVYGVMGFSQEGLIGCLFLDENGDIVRKNYNLSLVLNHMSKKRRPPSADIDFPTIITHEVGFTFDEKALEKYGDNPLKAMYDEIKTIQLVLLNENRDEVVGVLAETKGPWETYRQFNKEDEAKEEDL